MAAVSTDAANQPTMFSIRDAIRSGFMRYATPSLPRERRRKINCEQRFRLHWSMVPVARMSGHRAREAKRGQRSRLSRRAFAREQPEARSVRRTAHAGYEPPTAEASLSLLSILV
jgi:hypothetical protein